jgi:hypothetical protein
MANIMLTDKCNLRCSYCFAGSYINITPPTFLTKNHFARYLDFLDRSGINEIRILGGEPSLHPKFHEFIKEALESLLCLSSDRVNVLVNVTPVHHYDKMELRIRQFEVLASLGQRAHIGYTIFRPDTSGLFNIIKFIEQTDCRRSVRIGLSQPGQNGNVTLSPKHYRRVAKGILLFSHSAYKNKIQVEFDCGFIRCMFTDSELIELKRMDVHFGWRCNPVIDVTGDLTAIPCFPLASVCQITDALNFTESELMEDFQKQIAHLRVVGIFAECSTCPLRVSEGCSGGCLSIAIQRMHKQSIVYPWPTPGHSK